VYVVSSLKKITFTAANSSLTPGGRTKMSISVGNEVLTDQLQIQWSTSNTRLSVSQKGVVSAKSVGVSTVKAALQGGILLTYRFTVDFATVKAKAAQSGKYVKVSWNEIKGADGYCIYRYNYKTKSDPVLIATVTKGSTVSYTDKKVKSGVSYAYQVFAFDSTQGETIYSTPSSWKNVTVS
jgi:hypothetical protein